MFCCVFVCIYAFLQKGWTADQDHKFKESLTQGNKTGGSRPLHSTVTLLMLWIVKAWSVYWMQKKSETLDLAAHMYPWQKVCLCGFCRMRVNTFKTIKVHLWPGCSRCSFALKCAKRSDYSEWQMEEVDRSGELHWGTDARSRGQIWGRDWNTLGKVTMRCY